MYNKMYTNIVFIMRFAWVCNNNNNISIELFMNVRTRFSLWRRLPLCATKYYSNTHHNTNAVACNNVTMFDYSFN